MRRTYARRLIAVWTTVALAGCGGGGSSSPGLSAGATSTPWATRTPAPPPPTASPAPTPTAALTAARWTSFGPEAGDVLQLLAAPGRAGVLFARAGGRVWRSHDDGASWSAASVPGERAAEVGSLLVLGPFLLVATSAGALFRSDDDGDSWRQVAAPIATVPATWVELLAADPVRGVVYAQSDFRLFVSEDGGESWLERTRPAEAVIHALTIDPADPDHLLAGQVSAGASSRDAGRTWTRFRMPSQTVFGDQPTNLSDFVLDLRARGRMLVAAGGGGVFETRDDGTTWQARNEGIHVSQGAVLPAARVLGAAPDDPDLLLLGSSGVLYRSSDGARSWSPTAAGPASADAAALLYRDARGDVVLAGMLGAGIARSDDGGRSWVPSSHGLHASFVTALAADPSDVAVLYAGTGTREARYGPVAPGPVGALLRSLDGGRSWQPARTGASAGEITGVAVDPATPGLVFATHETDGLLRSDDHGATWQAIGASWQPGLFGRIAVQPGDTGVLVRAARSLLRSDDGGRSWQETTVEATFEDGEKLCEFSDVAVDPHDPKRFYAASLGGVVVSTDSGAHWQGSATCSIFNLSLVRPGQFVLPDATTPGRVYASFRSMLHVSDDGGRTFAPVPLAPFAPLESVGAIGHDGEHLYVATERGVLRSRDGVGWESWNDGLEPQQVTGFALLRGNESALAAATTGNGVALRALR